MDPSQADIGTAMPQDGRKEGERRQNTKKKKGGERCLAKAQTTTHRCQLLGPLCAVLISSGNTLMSPNGGARGKDRIGLQPHVSRAGGRSKKTR